MRLKSNFFGLNHYLLRELEAIHSQKTFVTLCGSVLTTAELQFYKLLQVSTS